MIGRVRRSRLVTSSGARAGDDLVLAGRLGIEGTAILARDTQLLFDPGIGITRAARLICDTIRPHAMHDPTEGGLATAVREMALASGVGAILFDQPLPVLEVTRAVCERFGVEVLGLLSSGSILVACDPADTPVLLAAVPAATHIGRLVPASGGFQIGDRPLPSFDRDEVARVTEKS